MTGNLRLALEARDAEMIEDRNGKKPEGRFRFMPQHANLVDRLAVQGKDERCGEDDPPHAPTLLEGGSDNGDEHR